MKTIKYFLVLGILIIVTGCASVGDTQPQSKIERITPEELAKLLPPPVATMTLDEIVGESKQGKTADEIIAEIKKSNSRYELTPSQILDLNQRGVDTKVIDYIQQSNELAKQNAIADEMNRREKARAEVEQQLKRERLRRNRFYDPFWWGPRYRFYYGHPLNHRWRGSRFGWGLSYGYPYGW